MSAKSPHSPPSGPPKKACVIGWPISHSRSPLIHGFWLEKYGVNGTYDKHALPPEALADWLQAMREGSYAGCNVTIPHKQQAFKWVDECDRQANRLGAVNTISVQNGKLIGANTDGYGYFSHLRETIPGWQPKPTTALIIGAGGAARAITGVLLDAGVSQITVLNRTGEKAQALAEQLGPPVISARFDSVQEHLKQASLVVNTTPLGMTGNPPLNLDLAALPDHAIVSDIVYAPLETGLLKAARARGLQTLDGLGMLLHQAVPGFETWFGRRPQVTDALRTLIVRDLEQNP